MMEEVVFCVTVDTDMRVSSVVTRDESLKALVEVFDRHGVSGHVTWFLNENDFAMTHLHGDSLREIAMRGDAIGVHDHIDFLGGDWRYDEIKDFCSRSLDRVTAWLSGHGLGRPVAHRFGCGFQHPVAYRVLVGLGYTISSDVCPGTQHHNQTGELSFDNTDVPVGALPYRHGPAAINDYQTNAGPILQCPFMKAVLTAAWWPRLDRAVIEAWVKGAEKLGHDRAVLTFGFHPYEVVDQRKLKTDPLGIARLAEILTLLRDDYGARFASLEECAQLLGG